jgi:type IV pilus assembly protein PilV
MLTANYRSSSRGFTLVEVMVSLVVLGIGLLGIAKLVLFSAHSNDSAYLRSQATELAYAILDNMRGNRAIAMTQGYDTPLNTAPAVPGPCLGPAGCLPPTLAQYDISMWLTRLAAALPSGSGSIATVTNVVPTPGTTATITVQWDDAAAQTVFGGTAQGAAAPMTVTLETVL